MKISDWIYINSQAEEAHWAKKTLTHWKTPIQRLKPAQIENYKPIF